MSEIEDTGAALFPERVGDRLRAARTKAGLDLTDIATRTRIPLRHLSAIEAGDYASLPALTYCVGFVKAYARAVGADDVQLGRDVRAELGYSPEGRVDHADYDAADPARVPPRTYALTALALAVLIAGGYTLWRNLPLSGDASSEPTEAPIATEGANTNAAAAPAAPTAGQVVLTAKDAVWMKVYDKNRKTLFMNELKAGETYVVPADADGPMVQTGRADQLKVTIAGKEVAPLGPAERTVKDVGVSAAVLAARPVPANASRATTVPPTGN